MKEAASDDRRLVERIVGHRDERAFTTLYERHTTYLYRLALRLTGGNEAAAQDLVHDAWVRAVGRLVTFEWKSEIRTWLAAFVVNAERERTRAERDEVLLEDSIGADDGPLRGIFDRVDLERALASLAPRYRQVLVLHDIEGYTHDDISERLGIKPGTSKSQLSRARATVRRALGGSTHHSGQD